MGRSIPFKIRFGILKRDRFRCVYCGAEPHWRALQVDHVVPVARGGSDHTSNLATSCFDCNIGKSDGMIKTPRHGDDVHLLVEAWREIHGECSRETWEDLRYCVNIYSPMTLMVRLAEIASTKSTVRSDLLRLVCWTNAAAEDDVMEMVEFLPPIDDGYSDEFLQWVGAAEFDERWHRSDAEWLDDPADAHYDDDREPAPVEYFEDSVADTVF